MNDGQTNRIGLILADGQVRSLLRWCIEHWRTWSIGAIVEAMWPRARGFFLGKEMARDTTTSCGPQAFKFLGHCGPVLCRREL